MANEPIIVGTYGDPMSAHLARVQLESEGIQAFLLDEHLLTVDPLISGAIGGIKVVVSPADAQAARAVLTREGEGHDKPACPVCGSDRIQAHHAGRRSAFLTLLLLGIPIGRSRSKVICEECQHTWRK